MTRILALLLALLAMLCANVHPVAPDHARTAADLEQASLEACAKTVPDVLVLGGHPPQLGPAHVTSAANVAPPTLPALGCCHLAGRNALAAPGACPCGLAPPC